MYNFCTLFDFGYLLNGLALYESLKMHCLDFHLYIFAFDDQCYKILNGLDLQHATIISLSEFENERLLKVKGSRSKGEYCWTSTSSTILYVLKNFDVEMCTYLDADIYFFSSPAKIFEEMGYDSILITEHRYPNIYKWLESDGKYCVQFITFKKDKKGLNALNWWVDACIDWCYAILENGKFGDQKYLDDWKERFEGVHVLQNIGGGVAPWNVQQYEVNNPSGKYITGKEKKGSEFKIIFYHYHDLKILEDDKVQLSGAIFKLNKDVRNYIYAPYINHLLRIKKMLYEKYNFDVNSSKIRNSEIKKGLLYKIKNKFSYLIRNKNYSDFLSISFWLNNFIIFINMQITNYNIYNISELLGNENKKREK